MLSVYLSGEIHTNWREEIIDLCQKEDLKIKFSSPVTNHDASDNCGVEILGDEEKNFWKDNKGAKINSIKTKKSIKDCGAGGRNQDMRRGIHQSRIKSIIRVGV